MSETGRSGDPGINPFVPAQIAAAATHAARSKITQYIRRARSATTTLNRRLSALVRADAHHFLERHDEYLAVSNLAGLRRDHDRVDGLRRGCVGHRDLNLHLGKEINRVLTAAIDLRV